MPKKSARNKTKTAKPARSSSSSKKKARDSGLWGFEHRSLLEVCLKHSAGKKKKAIIHVSAEKTSESVQRVYESEESVTIYLHPLNATEHEKDPALQLAPTCRVRDCVGAVLSSLEKLDVGEAEFLLELNQEHLAAAILGLELALYKFKRVFKGEESSLRISLKNHGEALSAKEIAPMTMPAQAVNMARHLTNLPPNLLNPVSYAQAMQKWFARSPGLSVEVWDERRLERERMNLHLSVGRGSKYQPRLLKFKYRPRGASKQAPIALVGKGITFDTGGLDIKPAAAMRLMKKDMGGSAAVLGILDWAVRSKFDQPLDVYAALAENAIGQDAFRPSDVIEARNGLTVEIHNTDAEGRLVLADSLTLATESKQKPKCVIDVATLTGAIKVALGSGIAGLFSNDGELSQSLAQSGQTSGDFVWVMPLYQKYRSQMHSTFADMINSPDGFGGAITAALFLQKFVGDVPWAHLDVYAWKDSSDGAWTESGGSGQGVLCLVQWLQSLS